MTKSVKRNPFAKLRQSGQQRTTPHKGKESPYKKIRGHKHKAKYVKEDAKF